MVMGPVNDLMFGLHDMTMVKKSSVVDMIMVQVISLALGAFLLIAFSAYDMDQNELMYSMAFLFGATFLTGIVYRRLGDTG
jgi:hypothetical protein|tara:strand:- start:285 stop:527 length:243 start_codon:yes stop_codon:yes gene_type:complete